MAARLFYKVDSTKRPQRVRDHRLTKVHMTAKLPTPFQADDLLQGQGAKALPSADAVLTTDLSCDLNDTAWQVPQIYKSFRKLLICPYN